MSNLGPLPHIKLQIDVEGQLYIFDQHTGDRQLIAMRKNPDGSRTSRATATEVEDLVWNFCCDHKDSKKGDSKRPPKDEVSKDVEDEISP